MADVKFSAFMAVLSEISGLALADRLPVIDNGDGLPYYVDLDAIKALFDVSGIASNTETLSADLTLTDADEPIQFIDPGGAARDIELPAEAATNHMFIISNQADAAETLTVYDDGATEIDTVAQGETKAFFSDGTSWAALSGGGGGDSTDGWNVDTNTWTYASATTFTVTGDVTDIFRKGTFLKWTQTTEKFGVVGSSVYSSPNTTVTIIPTTDYEIANATITGTYISNQRDPNGFPSHFAYTVVWTAVSTNPVIGDGSLVGYWTPMGGAMIFVKLRITAGSTTTFGTGFYNFGIPISPAIHPDSIALESASGTMKASAVRYALSAFVRSDDIRGVYGTSILGQGSPVTLASGDDITLSCLYEF